MEERTVANLGRGDDAGETTLAAATAAIITARWGAPARAQRAPRQDEFAGMAGLGASTASSSAPVSSVPVSPIPVSPIPVITVPESNVPFSPFTPATPAYPSAPVSSGPVSSLPTSPGPVSAVPTSGGERVGGRASVSADRRLPPPVAPDGFDTGANGYGSNGHGPNGYGSHGYEADGFKSYGNGHDHGDFTTFGGPTGGSVAGGSSGDFTTF